MNPLHGIGDAVPQPAESSSGGGESHAVAPNPANFFPSVSINLRRGTGAESTVCNINDKLPVFRALATAPAPTNEKVSQAEENQALRPPQYTVAP